MGSQANLQQIEPLQETTVSLQTRKARSFRLSLLRPRLWGSACVLGSNPGLGGAPRVRGALPDTGGSSWHAAGSSLGREAPRAERAPAETETASRAAEVSQVMKSSYSGRKRRQLANPAGASAAEPCSGEPCQRPVPGGRPVMSGSPEALAPPASGRRAPRLRRTEEEGTERGGAI